MTIASIICLVLLALLILIFAVALRKKEGRIALRSAASCGQLSIIMTVVLSLFLMAQESVIYNNAQTGLYDAEGIDLFYMSKSAGVFCFIALAVAILCLVGSLYKKPAFLSVSASALVLVAIVVALWALTKYAPNYYYATLVPTVIFEGWCLLVLAVNALFDSEKTWCKIVITVVNVINFIAVAFAVLSISLLANSVFDGLSDVGNIMVVLLAVILIIVALPAVLNFIVAIMDTVAMIKQAADKSGE
ncbi:MAG: hypothetical protein IJF58_01535 [Clostridia bacterium]|nr:hypothetical protein [Clostridia bacterium]